MKERRGGKMARRVGGGGGFDYDMMMIGEEVYMRCLFWGRGGVGGGGVV